MKIIYTDALIVGGGLAGLRSAIAARDKGLDTIVISMVPVKRSHSAAAQGGRQASLGNSVKARGTMKMYTLPTQLKVLTGDVTRM